MELYSLFEKITNEIIKKHCKKDKEGMDVINAINELKNWLYHKESKGGEKTQ